MIGDYYTRLLQIGASGCPTNSDRRTDRPVAPPTSTVTIVYRHAPPFTLTGVRLITCDGWMLRFACVGVGQSVAVAHYIVLGSVAELVLEEQP